jgi:hypothetical protein
MCELYAAQQLIIPDEDTDWKEWGRGLKAIDNFSNEAIPDPNAYEDWFFWAQALVGVVNPRP